MALSGVSEISCPEQLARAYLLSLAQKNLRMRLSEQSGPYQAIKMAREGPAAQRRTIVAEKN